MNLMFKDSSSFSMFTQLTFMFSLQFVNYGCFSPCLICLVSFIICMFNSKKFIYGTFEDCIGLFNSLFHSFLCQNFCQVILLLLWQLSESLRHLFIINQHNIIFGSLYLILMHVVSHVNLLHTSLHPRLSYQQCLRERLGSKSQLVLCQNNIIFVCQRTNDWVSNML